MWFRVIAITAFCIILTSNESPCIEPSDIDSEYGKSIKSLEGKLQDQFKKIISEVVGQGRFGDAEQMLGERTRFMEGMEPPSSLELKTMTSAYIAKRKEIVATLRSSYMELITSATRDNEREKVIELRASLRIFELREALATTQKKATIKPKDQSVSIEEECANTEKFLTDFRRRFEDEIKRIEKLETSIRKAEAHKELVLSADAELQQKKLTIIFPVKNVVEENGGFSISFGYPEIIGKAFRDGQGLFANISALGGLPASGLSKKDAIALTSEDSIVISGKCRFIISNMSRINGFIPLIWLERGNGPSYEILCEGTSKQVVKKTGAVINIK